MPCVFVILALAVPRGLMFFIWLLTGWFGRAFGGALWPILGFLFMPYTTLAYMATMLNNNHVVSGWWLGLIIVAAIVDVGHWGGGGKIWRRRRVYIVNQD